MPLLPSGCPPVSLYSLHTIRRLCGLLRPAGGYFASASGRAEQAPKSKTAAKAICKPVERFLRPAVSLYSRAPKTPHRGRQRPAQGINQPRPAPSGVSRGFVICCGPERAPRSGSCRHPTRRSGGRHTARRYTPRGAARRQPGT